MCYRLRYLRKFFTVEKKVKKVSKAESLLTCGFTVMYLYKTISQTLLLYTIFNWCFFICCVEAEQSIMFRCSFIFAPAIAHRGY